MDTNFRAQEAMEKFGEAWDLRGEEKHFTRHVPLASPGALANFEFCSRSYTEAFHPVSCAAAKVDILQTAVTYCHTQCIASGRVSTLVLELLDSNHFPASWARAATSLCKLECKVTCLVRER